MQALASPQLEPCIASLGSVGADLLGPGNLYGLNKTRGQIALAGIAGFHQGIVWMMSSTRMRSQVPRNCHRPTMHLGGQLQQYEHKN